MDTTTQYKLNKYSKKINDAYQKNNITKVNEYMHHQFSYMNKYIQQQQQGGSLEEIKRAIANIEQNVKAIVDRIANRRELIGKLPEVMALLSSKEEREAVEEAVVGTEAGARAREAVVGVEAWEAVVGAEALGE
jgi:hypothetical protein